MPLLNLPRDIRKSIWSLVATYLDADGELRHMTLRDLKIRHTTFAALLRVNKQISTEAGECIYDDLIVWLRATGLERQNDNSALFSTLWINRSVLQYSFHEDKSYDHRLGIRLCHRMELPPMHFRQKLQKLKITLTVPEDLSLQGRMADPTTPLYKYDQFDWLYPIRELQGELGFGVLELLMVEVLVTGQWNAREKSELKGWVNQKVRDMDTDAETVTVEYKEEY